jgi:hypothetical protein
VLFSKGRIQSLPAIIRLGCNKDVTAFCEANSLAYLLRREMTGRNVLICSHCRIILSTLNTFPNNTILKLYSSSQINWSVCIRQAFLAKSNILN